MHTVADRIKALRKELGFTQLELGQAAGVSKAAVSQWERDVAKPDRDALLCLRRTQRVSPDWIAYGSGEMFVPGSHTGYPPDVQSELERRFEAAPAQAQRLILDILEAGGAVQESTAEYQPLSGDELHILKAYRQLAIDDRRRLLQAAEAWSPQAEPVKPLAAPVTRGERAGGKGRRRA